MGIIKIKKGLNLPIHGEPKQEIHTGKDITHVALIGQDYVGMKPQLAVSVGDHVKQGQLLFTDRKYPVIRFTSPGCGKVIAINRGERRIFQSIVIELNGEDENHYQSHTQDDLKSLDREQVITRLLESGLWTALRSRPFGTIPNPAIKPNSIFITAMDTNPLSPDVDKILQGREQSFIDGLHVISKLTEGKTYLCKAEGARIPSTDLACLHVREFSGPHPAGNAGTHIHFLDPVDRHKQVWHILAQDVCAVGNLFTTGALNVERVISLAGLSIKNPRLIKTRIGASIEDLTKDEIKDGNHRIISGSVLSGHKAEGDVAFLGRFHQQISIIPEFDNLGFFSWLSPGLHRFSVKNIFLSRLVPRRRFDFTTAVHGGERTIVPVGSYEKVMPLDVLPTYLLRALAVDDIDEAEKLGCLELGEEDLALCTFVCPSKIDHGENLRRNLTLIEKEG